MSDLQEQYEAYSGEKNMTLLQEWENATGSMGLFQDKRGSYLAIHAHGEFFVRHYSFGEQDGALIDASTIATFAGAKLKGTLESKE